MPTSANTSNSHGKPQASNTNQSLSSSSSHGVPHAEDINGGIIKFYNKRCCCGYKAVIKISQTPDNPHKVFYNCRTSRCGFFKWWSPIDNEANEIIARRDLFLGTHDDDDNGMDTSQVLRDEVNSRFDTLESTLKATKTCVNVIIILLLLILFISKCNI